MVSARVQLRVVAGLYASFGAVCLLWIAMVWTTASSAPSASLTHQVAERYASAIPSVAARAIGSFVLSVLSLRLLMLTRSWRMATAVGSVLFSLLIVLSAARVSAVDIPVYLAMEREDYSVLAIVLGLWWGLALVYSVCSYLLWRQLRASNNRWRGP
jgi:hypothetical protein